MWILRFSKINVRSCRKFVEFPYTHWLQKCMSWKFRTVSFAFRISGLEIWNLKYIKEEIGLKKKRSDSVLRQKPFHQQKIPKSEATTQKHDQKLRLHNDCWPTKDGQLEWRTVTKLVWFYLPTNRKSFVIKRTHSQIYK